jgi:hypothetical protein
VTNTGQAVDEPDADVAGDDQSEGVTERTASTLRAAMDRLLAGRPTRTDGRLTKDNLWKEAGVSRATMNRARLIMAEWETRVGEVGGMTPAEARKDDEVHRLRAELEAKTRECTELNRKLDAAATAIAALHHDNILLCEELGARGVLLSLDARRGELRGTFEQGGA